MKTRKQIFRNFQYLECDAFAEYLEGMAAKGWRFTGWKLGMIFEKEEPGKRVYSVEVFLKGREEDVSPSKEAQEYAEYCEKAGWKFIDARGKFCVFEQLDEDAVPIVEPQEKLESIRKAECGSTLYRTVMAGILFFLTLLQLFAQFADCIFDEYHMILLVFWGLLFFLQGISVIRSVILCVCYQRQIRQGKIPYYRKIFHVSKAGLQLLAFGTVFCLLVLGIKSGVFSGGQGFFLMSFFLILVVIQILRKWMRFSREKDAFWNVIMCSFCVMILILTAGNALDSMNHNIPQKQFPLLPQHLKEQVFQVEGIDQYWSKSICGIKEGYWLTYQNQKQQEESLRYTIYSSPYEWVLSRIWKEETQNLTTEEKSKGWSGKKVASVFGIYYVYYEQKILYLSVEEPLTQEQIRVIESRLGLKE